MIAEADMVMVYIGLPHPLVFQRRRLLPSLYMCTAGRLYTAASTIPSVLRQQCPVQSSPVSAREGGRMRRRRGLAASLSSDGIGYYSQRATKCRTV